MRSLLELLRLQAVIPVIANIKFPAVALQKTNYNADIGCHDVLTDIVIFGLNISFGEFDCIGLVTPAE